MTHSRQVDGRRFLKKTGGRGLMLLPALVCLVASFEINAASLPDFAELARNNSPSVVNISSTVKASRQDDRLPPGISPDDVPEDGPLSDFFRRFFGEPGPGMPDDVDPRASLGSGFIISEDGYIITNNHVVRDADEIVVRMSDRSELTATVVGSDPRSDIAVLKVESERALPAVSLGSSEALEVGAWVLAIGSPFGFDYSVTAGIVSAKGRSLPNENYVPFIQTDVAINPGNSGGPLFNLDGEVVGVNSQIYSRTGGFMGVSFAIPIDVVVNVYEQLKNKGSVTRGWLGVLIQDVTAELAESFGMEKPRGALVSKVLDESPAAKGGIQTGDIIVRFGSKAIDHSSDLPPVVGTTQVGDVIAVELIRGGRTMSVELTIGALPEDPEKLASAGIAVTSAVDEVLKISVEDLSAEQREQFQVPQGGVMIQKIENGPAQAAGLRRGDVILQLNNSEIENASQFHTILSDLPSGKTIPVLIQRQGAPLFLAIKTP